ncbi:MAG: pyridoxal phosphate enzyme (YggS family) [Rickettsiales bacterium]|jgi:pyridoxal phosphate enzyme (YggS family)
MSSIKENIKEIENKIKLSKKSGQDVSLVAISKYFPKEKIQQAINAGHSIFGENKVQEAKLKWQSLKREHPNIKLHLVGHLQSNKVKDAVTIFDTIQTLDSIKLAKILESEMTKQNKFPEIFIQVNIGKELQKNGIDSDNLDNFLHELESFPKLNICGLMSIAPKNKNSKKYFIETYNLAKKYNLQNISMGMSSDFECAIENGANFIRVGSAIFGARDG